MSGKVQESGAVPLVLALGLTVASTVLLSALVTLAVGVGLHHCTTANLPAYNSEMSAESNGRLPFLLRQLL